MSTLLVAEASTPSYVPQRRLQERPDDWPQREVTLDTETTGLDPNEGHRIVEIGCIELLRGQRTGRTFHSYLNPERSVPKEATAVHGLVDSDLSTAPRFADIGREFLEFVHGSILVAHNAKFDVAFLDAELRQAGSRRSLADFVTDIIDTLPIARSLHPNLPHDLRNLCRLYGVNVEGRHMHGALIDADLLTSVYCAMCLAHFKPSLFPIPINPVTLIPEELPRTELLVQQPTEAERIAHEEFLDQIDRQCPGGSLWRRLRP